VSHQSGFPAWLRLNPHAQVSSRQVVGTPVSGARPASFRAGGGWGGSSVVEWNVLDRAILRSAVTLSGSEDLPGKEGAGSNARAPAENPGEGRVGLGDGRGTADVRRDNPMHPREVRYAILEAEDTTELARLIETYRFGSLFLHHRTVSLLLFAPLLRILTWKPALRVFICDSRKSMKGLSPSPN